VLAAMFVGLWYREIDCAAPQARDARRRHADRRGHAAGGASVLMGGFLTRAQVPQELAQAILDFTDNKYMILLILNVFFLIIGLFLHSAAAIILVVPIVMPLINQQAGIDPVHFGLVVTLNLAIGQQTPPVASVLITACSVAGQHLGSFQGQHLVRRRAAGGAAALHLRAGVPMFLVEYFYR
jgi:TRAP-type C4-dicarboxylate transport system permease large subunit